MKIWHTINMNKIDKIEHEGGCSFFIHELIKNATLVAGGKINVY